MPEVSNLPLGRKIELLRHRRGISRRVLASLVGYSPEWLRQVEKGKIQVDRLSVLIRLAEVLQVKDVSRFLGIPADRAKSVQENGPASGSVRDALLHRWSPVEAAPSSDRVATEWLHSRLMEAFEVWRDSARRYSRVLNDVSELLNYAKELDRHDDREACKVLAHAHRLTSLLLRQLGDYPLALLAIERGMLDSRMSRDEATQVACSACYGAALLDNGFPDEAMEFCLAILRHVGHRAADGAPELLRAWGAMHLTAAEVAAVNNDQDRAWRLLEGAHRAADRVVQEHDGPVLPFNSTDVDTHSIRIELILGNDKHALKQAAKVDVVSLPTKERRVQYYVCLARAYARSSQAVGATWALSQAEEACPEEMSFNAEAREVLQAVLLQDDAVVRHELWALAERAGLL
ncbi:helix-turn-helix transcriptional regulator [Streptomyces sp. NPDC002838]|uniref:helix-turn-helix domain-containing protein n=1 Tax=Streptomyces sp. NPDC002838 TaxID=3154436 RepID=UPI00331ABD20